MKNERALQGFTQSFEMLLKSNRDALVQLQNTKLAISRLKVPNLWRLLRSPLLREKMITIYLSLPILIVGRRL